MRYYKILTTVLLLLGLSFPLSAEIVVVVAKGSKISEISSKDLKRVYTGKTKKVKGNRIIPVITEVDAVHKGFLSKYVGRTPIQFSKTWQKLVFSGKATLPKRYSSESDLINAIASNPKAIGYIDKSKVDDRVKIVAVK